MQQIKLFKTIETDIRDLEREINTWLSQGGVRVVNIFGNISPQTAGRAGGSSATITQSPGTGTRQFHASDIFLAVVYEKG